MQRYNLKKPLSTLLATFLIFLAENFSLSLHVFFKLDMFFSFDISLLTGILLTAGLLLGATYAVWKCFRAKRLSRFVDFDEQNRDYVDELPSVSIIVDACTETGQLSRFLPLVLTQEYPEFEVVVVANSEAESTSDALSSLKVEHPNLRITFAPHGTRTLSRKKLALMIGIKAAQYDIVLTTCANCRVTSEQWLTTMMRNFTPEVDIVLGYSHYRYHRDKRWGRRLRVFDTVSTGAQWLLSAVHGHPYRGVTENLAYRKQIFFDHSGFSRSMELLWGADDVFVSEIAQGRVARVELAPDSQVSVYYDNLRHAHRVLKVRRDFTSHRVRRKSFIVQAFMSWMWWLGLAALVAAVITAWPNAVVLIAAVVILISLCGVVSWAMARLCAVLQAPQLWITAPLLAWWRPLVNFCYRIREARHAHSNYTNYI